MLEIFGSVEDIQENVGSQAFTFVTLGLHEMIKSLEND